MAPARQPATFARCIGRPPRGDRNSEAGLSCLSCSLQGIDSEGGSGSGSGKAKKAGKATHERKSEVVTCVCVDQVLLCARWNSCLLA